MYIKRLIKAFTLLAVCFTTLILLGMTVFARTAMYQNDFSNGAYDWSVISGTWALEGSEFSANGTSNINTVGSSTWTNYEFESSIKLNNASDCGALSFRYTDTSNYYLLYITSGNSNIQLVRVKAGISTTLQTYNVGTTFTTGNWYKLKVRLEGNQIGVIYNGNTVISYNDTNSLTQGKIGFIAWNGGGGNSNVHFDNVLVMSIDEPVLYSTAFSSNSNGWSSVNGTWAVESGEYSATGAAAFAVTGDDWTDYEVSADIKLLTAGDRAGIVFGVKDTNNYYLAHIAENNSNIYLYKIVNGSTTLITSGNSGSVFALNTFYNLRVRFSGTAINIYCRGGVSPVISVTDSTFTYGKVGLRAWPLGAQCHTHFDNVTVKDLVTYYYKNDFSDNNTSYFDFGTGAENTPEIWCATRGILEASTHYTGFGKATGGYGFWTDYEVKVDFFVASKLQNAGIYFRYTDDTHTYLADLSAENSTLYLHKMTPSGTTLLASQSISNMQYGAWYSLRVKCTGNVIKLFVEQKDKLTTPTLSYTDSSSPYYQGKVGLASWNSTSNPNDSAKTFTLYYDNFEVVASETHKLGTGNFLFKSDFESGSQDWAAYSGTWAAETEEYSATGSDCQSFAGDSTWTDYTMTADFCIKNTADRVGLILRSDSTINNCYLIHICEGTSGGDSGSTNLYIYKVQGGVVTLLKKGAANTTFKQNTWYRLKVKVQGDLIEVLTSNVDTPGNEFSLSIRDSFRTSGKIGLRAWNDSTNCHVHFDNIYVTPNQSISYATSTPQLISTSYITDEKIIASFNVTSYGASAGSTLDATAAFQAAINDAYKAGGAVVWVPTGHYRIYGSLEILPGVTLRGDWKNPENGGLGLGTVLDIYGGKDNPDGKPAITIRGSASVKGLTLWYPEQDVNNVHAYPWAIFMPGSMIHGAGANRSVENVTLINPYYGIKISGEYNFSHYVANVFGTPLKKGWFEDNCYDVGKVHNVKFAPNYWRDCGFAGAPTGTAETTLRNYTRTNGIGLHIAHSDFSCFYDIKTESYNIGMEFSAASENWSNCMVWGIDADDCNIGMDMDKINYVLVSNPDISANTTGIRCTANFGAIGGKVLVERGTISSGNRCIEELGTGRLQIQGTAFTNWSSSTEAVYSSSGTLTLQGCSFSLNQRHINLTSGVNSGAILGNTFNGYTPQVLNSSSGDIKINHNNFNFAVMPVTGHSWGTMRQPSSNNFYNVTAAPYNAVGDGVTDDTTAIQNALNAAGSAGGGTVYIPAGRYKIATHLSVPANVELRGVGDEPMHTQPGVGTILYVYEGKNNPSGTPFITLSQNAGVRGLIIWYPEQKISDDGTSFFSYPWTIRGTGTGVYVINTAMSTAYNGIDFGTYNTGNHLIKYLGGSIINQGIFVSNNSTAGTEGWIEDTMINPHYSYDSALPGKQSGSWSAGVIAQRNNLVMMKFGKTLNEHVFGGFAYASKYMYQFIGDASGKCTGTFIMCSADGCKDTTIRIDGADTVKFISSVLVAYEWPGGDYNDYGPRKAFETASTFTGTAEMYNMNIVGVPGNSVFAGGTITLQNLNIEGAGNTPGIIQITGGITKINNIYMEMPSNQISTSSGITSANITGNGGKNSFGVTDNSGGKTTIQYNYVRTQ